MKLTTPQIEMLEKRWLALAMNASKRRRKGDHCGHELRRAMYYAQVARRLLISRAKQK